ncbi:hypothetical protein KJ636_04745 [Patescibacteria group bacterium]|nr:hypothetical protein [Patescibacteria group bacterium]MBU4480820.1 hypothetical protein [Patescibacteria group bacterium]
MRESRREKPTVGERAKNAALEKIEQMGEGWEAEGAKTEKELRKLLDTARKKIREKKEPKPTVPEEEQKKSEEGGVVVGPGGQFESLEELRKVEEARKTIKEIIEKGKLEPGETKPKTPEEEERSRKLTEKIIKESKARKETGRGRIETRPEAIKEVVVGLSKKFRNLVGNDSPEAWGEREKLLK